MTIDLLFDCHMHSTFSDGSHSIDRVVKSAIDKGLKTIAITDHMPLPFATRYAMDITQLEEYRRSISKARDKYRGRIQILAGMEMEYIPGQERWIQDIAELDWDMLLISVHGMVTDQGHFMVNGREDEFKQTLELVFENDIKSFCTRYYQIIQQAVSTGWFQAAAHLDVIKKHNTGSVYFNETADWYKNLVLETLDALAHAGMKLEINMNGVNHPTATPYPSKWIAREAADRGIPLILGSDAHAPRFQAQYFNRVQKMI